VYNLRGASRSPPVYYYITYFCYRRATFGNMRINIQRILAVALVTTLAMMNFYFKSRREDPNNSKVMGLNSARNEYFSRVSPHTTCTNLLRPPPLVHLASNHNEARNWSFLDCYCGSYSHLRRSESVCWPTYFIIGANKAGTSSMYHYLSAHPDVYPAIRKELHYWTFRFSTKPSKVSMYLRNFSAAVKQYRHVLAQKSSTNSPIVTGEATPDLHYYPIAAMRLKALLPSARFILIRRPAIELAYSTYNYNRGKFHSPKNADRFAPYHTISRLLELDYATTIVERIAQAASKDKSPGRGARSSSAVLFKNLHFVDWVSLFALEIESCLVCRSMNVSSQVFSACLRLKTLQVKVPTLFRHQEDVSLDSGGGSDLLSFGGRLPRLEQCWFPPVAHHLNFFARSAYSRQVALWRRFFPSRNEEQLLEVDSVSFFTKPAGELRRVAAFLGLSSFDFPSEALAVKLQGPPRFIPKVVVQNQLDSPDVQGVDISAESIAKATASGKQKAATDHSMAPASSREKFLELSGRLEVLAAGA